MTDETILEKFERLRELRAGPKGQPGIDSPHPDEIDTLAAELEAWARQAKAGHTALEYACALFMKEDPSAHWCVTQDNCRHVRELGKDDSEAERERLEAWLEEKREMQRKAPAFAVMPQWNLHRVELWCNWEKGRSTDPAAAMELLEAMMRIEWSEHYGDPWPDDSAALVLRSIGEWRKVGILGGDRGDIICREQLSAADGDNCLAIARACAVLAARGIERGGEA